MRPEHFVPLQKFNAILRLQNPSQYPEVSRKWVTNLSCRQLTPSEISVQAKGLNFAVTAQNIPVPQMVVAIEDGHRHVDQTAANTIRTTIVGLLNNPKLPPPNMTEQKALKSLQRDTSIVIVPTDKGRSTVLLDQSTYDQKIWDLLSDEKTYKVLPRNPAPALERRMNDLLRYLKRSGATPGCIAQQARLHFYMVSQRSISQTFLSVQLPRSFTPRLTNFRSI